MKATAGSPAVKAAVTGLTGRRVQAIVIGLVVLVSTAASTLALGLLVDSNAPFDHAFASAARRARHRGGERRPGLRRPARRHHQAARGDGGIGPVPRDDRDRAGHLHHFPGPRECRRVLRAGGPGRPRLAGRSRRRPDADRGTLGPAGRGGRLVGHRAWPVGVGRGAGHGERRARLAPADRRRRGHLGHRYGRGLGDTGRARRAAHAGHPGRGADALPLLGRGHERRGERGHRQAARRAATPARCSARSRT